jgi:hypothetical protein
MTGDGGVVNDRLPSRPAKFRSTASKFKVVVSAINLTLRRSRGIEKQSFSVMLSNGVLNVVGLGDVMNSEETLTLTDGAANGVKPALAA